MSKTMVNINICNFHKGMSTLAMWSNGPLPQGKYIKIDIYIDPVPQKSMGCLSILSNLSTCCQVISKIQKCPKLVEATLFVSHVFGLSYGYPPWLHSTVDKGSLHCSVQSPGELYMWAIKLASKNIDAHNSLFGVVCRVCEDARIKSSPYAIKTFQSEAIMIGSHKLIIKELIPNTMHQLTGSESEFIFSGFWLQLHLE